LFPAGTAGAAFTSNPTIQPTPEELAEELEKLQLAATANQSEVQQIINKTGPKTEQTDDPGKKRLIAANLIIITFKNRSINTVSNEEKIKVREARKFVTKIYSEKKKNETADIIEQRRISNENYDKAVKAKEAAGLTPSVSPSAAGAAGYAGAAGAAGKKGKKAKKKKQSIIITIEHIL